MANEMFMAPLMRVPVLQGLTQPQLTEIARRAERVMFRIGQTIIKEGSAGDGAFLIIVGDGERRDATGAVSPVVTGSLIGEMAMLIDTEYGSTIVAKTAIRAIKITRAALYQQMERDPELAAHFVAKIAGRLHDFQDQLRCIEAELDAGAPVALPRVAQLAAAPPALQSAAG
jgi:CRP/FNR family transcriptional regulator, cyclic AMP receptor protein